jgi:hypothetical protein
MLPRSLRCMPDLRQTKAGNRAYKKVPKIITLNRTALLMLEKHSTAMDKVPFQKFHQLSSSLDVLSSTSLQHATLPLTLPDFPNISLSDKIGLAEFLKEDLHPSDLEKMAPYLWMLSTQSSHNIGSLTHQRVKGRQIIIAEDPKLHLVWVRDRIFVKPLPTYLLSHAFWVNYLGVGTGDHEGDTKKDEIRRSTVGFLRTYAFLIKHPSDFRIAKELCLIPGDCGTTLEKFAKFRADLEGIVDEDVSGRYQFGELRLNRLNFYIKFVLGKWSFQKVQTTTAEYFGRFYGPLLFVFTSLSLILSALQTEMAVEQVLSQSGAGSGSGILDRMGGIEPWMGFWLLTRWVAVLSFVIISLLTFLMAGLLVSLHAREWIYAIKDKLKKGRNHKSGQTQTSRGR